MKGLAMEKHGKRQLLLSLDTLVPPSAKSGKAVAKSAKSAQALGKAKQVYRVEDIDELRDLLQGAVELEHATIPPYLCALYSIMDGTNHASVEIIQSVVMEEMLHMILAANVLNAIGGHPIINQRDFIPRYPKTLPIAPDGQTKRLRVGLEPFSKHSVETFVKIEQPDEAMNQPGSGDEATEHSCVDDFHSIGDFYNAIVVGLKTLNDKGNIFTGDRALQITPETYYGGGGKVTEVTNLKSAIEALDEIISQGEGQNDLIWGGNLNPGVEDFLEVAHFFRFDQILKGRFYKEGDTRKSGPSGAKFTVDWNAVYPMATNPKLADYKKDSELWQKTNAFNKTYQALLEALHDATNGKQGQLVTAAVPLMYELKYQAVELMKIPRPDGKGTAGPSFEYFHDC